MIQCLGDPAIFTYFHRAKLLKNKWLKYPIINCVVWNFLYLPCNILHVSLYSSNRKANPPYEFAKVHGCVILPRDLKKQAATTWKMNMEPKHDGLEDDFPFQLGDILGFLGSSLQPLIFRVFRKFQCHCNSELIFRSTQWNNSVKSNDDAND